MICLFVKSDTSHSKVQKNTNLSSYQVFESSKQAASELRCQVDQCNVLQTWTHPRVTKNQRGWLDQHWSSTSALQSVGGTNRGTLRYFVQGVHKRGILKNKFRSEELLDMLQNVDISNFAEITQASRIHTGWKASDTVGTCKRTNVQIKKFCKCIQADVLTQSVI